MLGCQRNKLGTFADFSCRGYSNSLKTNRHNSLHSPRSCGQCSDHGNSPVWIGRKIKSHKAQFLLLGALVGPQAPEEIFISHWIYFLRSMQSNLSRTCVCQSGLTQLNIVCKQSHNEAAVLCRILKITFGMQVRFLNSYFSVQITFENLLLGVYVSGQYQKLFNCQITCQHVLLQSPAVSRFPLLCCPLVDS